MSDLNAHEVIVSERVRLHPIGWLWCVAVMAMFIFGANVVATRARNTATEREELRRWALGGVMLFVALPLPLTGVVLGAWGAGGRYVYRLRAAGDDAGDLYFGRTFFGRPWLSERRIGAIGTVTTEVVPNIWGSASLLVSTDHTAQGIYYTYLGKASAERLAAAIDQRVLAALNSSGPSLD